MLDIGVHVVGETKGIKTEALSLSALSTIRLTEADGITGGRRHKACATGFLALYKELI